ncbi:sugar-phosphatase [Clostridium carnis]
MRKLLATDLDGTLLKDNNISSENRQAVEKLQNDNILVVSTGRPYNGITFLKDDHKIEADYYVLLNGALIINKAMEKVKHEIIESKTINDILNDYKEDSMAISVESGYKTYLLTDWDNLPYPNKIRVKAVDNIEEDLSLISIYIPDKSIKYIEDLKNNINSKYGSKVIAYRNDVYIDIVPVGCSKGHGVECVAKRTGIEKSRVYTIGDSWNDVTMFNVTNNAFTFHHVEEELKKHANYLVSSVAECIENFIIKEI